MGLSGGAERRARVALFGMLLVKGCLENPYSTLDPRPQTPAVIHTLNPKP